MTTIKIQDFGPIGQAEVELKPLTVLIGPNNTGKSYLALAIYSLQRSLTYHDVRQRSRRRSRRARARQETRLASRRIENALDQVDQLVPLLDKIKSGEATLGDVPEVIIESLLQEFPGFLETSASNFDYELRVCFGSNGKRPRKKKTTYRTVHMVSGIDRRTHRASLGIVLSRRRGNNEKPGQATTGG